MSSKRLLLKKFPKSSRTNAEASLEAFEWNLLTKSIQANHCSRGFEKFRESRLKNVIDTWGAFWIRQLTIKLSLYLIEPLLVGTWELHLKHHSRAKQTAEQTWSINGLFIFPRSSLRVELCWHENALKVLKTNRKGNWIKFSRNRLKDQHSAIEATAAQNTGSQVRYRWTLNELSARLVLIPVCSATQEQAKSSCAKCYRLCCKSGSLVDQIALVAGLLRLQDGHANFTWTKQNPGSDCKFE